MKRVLMLAAVLAAGLAVADDRVARTGADFVRIRTLPCSSPEVLALLSAELHDRFQEAVTSVEGKTFRGCWTLLPDGRVFLRYEDGDAGMVPLREFKPGT